MSMLLAMGTMLFWLIPAAAAAVVMGIIAGVPNCILGPSRITKRESVGDIMTVAGIGLVALFIFQLVCGKIFGVEPQQLKDYQSLILTSGSQLFALIVMLVTTAVVRDNGFKCFGISLNRIPRGIGAGILAIVVVLPLILLINIALEAIYSRYSFTPNPHEMLKDIQQNHANRWMQAAIVFAAVVVAPMAEEFFFRGCVQTIIRYSIRLPWATVALSALIFAIAHDWWTWPEIFFLGLCLGYLYERTANLWACVVLHALFNCSMIFLFWKLG